MESMWKALAEVIGRSFDAGIIGEMIWVWDGMGQYL
jgi:hypothetical protein